MFGNEDFERLTDEIGTFVPEQGLREPVEEHDPTVLADCEHRVRSRLQHLTVPFARKLARRGAGRILQVMATKKQAACRLHLAPVRGPKRRPSNACCIFCARETQTPRAWNVLSGEDDGQD
jgi:hypothetical protein